MFTDYIKQAIFKESYKETEVKLDDVLLLDPEEDTDPCEPCEPEEFNELCSEECSHYLYCVDRHYENCSGDECIDCPLYNNCPGN